jgi:hypothetical protein
MPAHTGHIDGKHGVAVLDEFYDGFGYAVVTGRANSLGLLA